MKLIEAFTTLLVVTATFAHVAAVLPPGYEDVMWCPNATCRIYINPYGIVGGASTFNKCYLPSKRNANKAITEAVWTGNGTNVTAPEGWIEPEICSSKEFSECTTDDDCTPEIDSGCVCYASSSKHSYDPCIVLNLTNCNETQQCAGDECSGFVAKCIMGGTCKIFEESTLTSTSTPATVSTTTSSSESSTEDIDPDELKAMSGPCTSDEDCFATIRSRTPTLSNFTGVPMCGCYAASDFGDPFDECEGEDDSTCPTARCRNTCEGLEAYCPTDEEEPLCSLREIAGDPTIATQPATSESITDDIDLEDLKAMSGPCTSDEDCVATIRSRSPTMSNVTGVPMCGCYAASTVGDPFDECEGEDDSCTIAKCRNTCEGLEAYCPTDEEEPFCSLREIGDLSTPTPPTGTTTIDPDKVGITTTPPDLEAMSGPCETDDDCIPRIRSRIPDSNRTGVGLCKCYASSTIEPFDECEGAGDMTCPIASCKENDCKGMEAYCTLGPDDNGMGFCALRSVTGDTTTAGPTTAGPATATAHVSSDGNASSKATEAPMPSKATEEPDVRAQTQKTDVGDENSGSFMTKSLLVYAGWVISVFMM